jgi:TetR/AcrR family transcriptional regulator, transcriptional repressor for nem operon
LLNNLHSVRDLVHWRDEVVRLEQRRDDGIRSLGDLAELLADGDEAGRSAVRTGFAAWESLLAGGITRVRDSGELAAKADPERLATGLMAALQGGLLLARITRDVRQLEVALDMALGYVRAHAVRNDFTWSSAISRAISMGLMSCAVSARRYPPCKAAISDLNRTRVRLR